MYELRRLKPMAIYSKQKSIARGKEKGARSKAPEV